MRLTPQYLTFYQKAVQILLDGEISIFPYDPIALVQKNGVSVVSYERFAAVSGTARDELLEISQDGFCICRKGEFMIVYNREILSKGRKRWTILHELSHILLGHINAKHQTVYQRRYEDRRCMEAEADILTACLIAPFPVALLCGITDAEEMRRLFGLSKEAAQNLYRDYHQLCISRQLPALSSEPLLQQCAVFALHYQLGRYYRNNGKRSNWPFGFESTASTISEEDFR